MNWILRKRLEHRRDSLLPKGSPAHPFLLKEKRSSRSIRLIYESKCQTGSWVTNTEQTSLQGAAPGVCTSSHPQMSYLALWQGSWTSHISSSSCPWWMCPCWGHFQPHRNEDVMLPDLQPRIYDNQPAKYESHLVLKRVKSLLKNRLSLGLGRWWLVLHIPWSENKAAFTFKKDVYSCDLM